MPERGLEDDMRSLALPNQVRQAQANLQPVLLFASVPGQTALLLSVNVAERARFPVGSN